MSRYKFLLFDLDGTLMDTAPGIFSVVRYTMEKMGLEEPQDMRRFLGPPLFRSMKEFCGLDDERALEAVRIYREKYPVDGLFDSEKFEGVEDMLKEFVDSGYVLGVATSKPEPFARSLLDHFDMAKYFAFIGGSGVDGARDTKREVIEYTLDNLGIADRNSVLMIGDRLHDIVGAKECGLDSVYVLWGYGSRKEAEECGADVIVETPADCCGYITSRN